jgi:hypothetical protein
MFPPHKLGAGFDCLGRRRGKAGRPAKLPRLYRDLLYLHHEYVTYSKFL